MTEQLKEKIQLLPRSPGVYKFLDENGELLYIGKATNLHSRVSSYFSSDISDRPRIIQMIPFVHGLDFTQTDNEIEALILESALIKKYLPKYNSDLKDDKSYAWLYITTKDEYPTVKIIRTLNKSEYNRGLLFGPYPSGRPIRRVFNYIRKIYPFCTSKDPTKPCFYSRIGLCPGPDVTKEEYRSNIDGIIRFLKGNNRGHIRELEKQMAEYSENQEFEKAADLRDKIEDLKYLGSEIKFTYFSTEQEYIKERDTRSKVETDKIRDTLGMKKLERIECYDISNIQGKLSYGSMVVSINGVPQSHLYRVFKIKSLNTPNDPEMLKEALERRLKHIGNDTDESLVQKPDMILIDGGKTQLSTVREVIPSDIFILGITKGRKYRRKGGKLKDEFWIITGEGSQQVQIPKSTSLSLLRDEAHRFALLHHRKLRKFVQKKSVLDEIKGVGEVTRRKLIKTFGSLDGLKSATLEDIDKVVKNSTTSSNIVKRLRETSSN
ncbi:excinuclease ABC subunit UvrC [Candidatus Dojkabacteria bacterium]|nr:excinuclease ABC subunit UvrC [Candidatus Dojkabacteria bacterium]